MDLSNREGDSKDKAKHQVAKQQRVIRRCYTCGKHEPLTLQISIAQTASASHVSNPFQQPEIGEV